MSFPLVNAMRMEYMFPRELREQQSSFWVVFAVEHVGHNSSIEHLQIPHLFQDHNATISIFFTMSNALELMVEEPMLGAAGSCFSC